MRYFALLLALAPATMHHHNLPEWPKPIGSIEVDVEADVKVSADQVKCLATMVYGEARGESFTGKVAVAYTALNRATTKTLCQVVLAPKQYSIFNNNPALKIAATSLHIEPKQKNNIDEDSWEESKRVAHLVAKRLIKDPTQGATHYFAPKLMAIKKYKYPKWISQYTLVAVIDQHRFYKPHYPKKG